MNKSPTAAPAKNTPPAEVTKPAPVSQKSSHGLSFKGVAKKLFSKRSSPPAPTKEASGGDFYDEVVISRPFGLQNRIHVDLDPNQGFVVRSCVLSSFPPFFSRSFLSHPLSFAYTTKGIPEEWKDLFDEVVTFWNRHTGLEPSLPTPNLTRPGVPIPDSGSDAPPLPLEEAGLTLDELVNKQDPKTLYHQFSFLAEGYIFFFFGAGTAQERRDTRGREAGGGRRRQEEAGGGRRRQEEAGGGQSVNGCQGSRISLPGF
jgi:hypothetical protein